MPAPSIRRASATANAVDQRAGLGGDAKTPTGALRDLDGLDDALLGIDAADEAEILAPPSFGFNLSHTKGLVACVVAIGRDVGIDVERVDRTSEIDSLCASHFSRSEVEQLAACSAHVRRDRFFDTWTLKEAYGKAIGRGLGHPLDSTTFDLTSPGSIGFTNCPGEGDRSQSKNPCDDEAQWQFHLFSPAPCFRLALATRSLLASHIVAREWVGG